MEEERKSIIFFTLFKQISVLRIKAFFLNDPSRAHTELTELSQIDRDMSGIIDVDELMEHRQKTVKLSKTEKMMDFSPLTPTC